MFGPHIDEEGDNDHRMVEQEISEGAGMMKPQNYSNDKILVKISDKKCGNQVRQDQSREKLLVAELKGRRKPIVNSR